MSKLIYLVPLTPLDCVMVKMGYEALCIPGTGLTRYPVAARVLLELLPRLLPITDDEVTSIINMVRMESNNGYDLLWRIGIRSDCPCHAPDLVRRRFL